MIAVGDFLLPFLLNWVNIPTMQQRNAQHVCIVHRRMRTYDPEYAIWDRYYVRARVRVCCAFVIRFWPVWLVVGIAQAKSLHLGLSSKETYDK